MHLQPAESHAESHRVSSNVGFRTDPEESEPTTLARVNMDGDSCNLRFSCTSVPQYLFHSHLNPFISGKPCLGLGPNYTWLPGIENGERI